MASRINNVSINNSLKLIADGHGSLWKSNFIQVYRDIVKNGQTAMQTSDGNHKKKILIIENISVKPAKYASRFGAVVRTLGCA